MNVIFTFLSFFLLITGYYPVVFVSGQSSLNGTGTVGSSCTADSDCGSDLNCSNGMCSTFSQGGVNSPCSSSSDCGFALICQNNSQTGLSTCQNVTAILGHVAAWVIAVIVVVCVLCFCMVCTYFSHRRGWFCFGKRKFGAQQPMAPTSLNGQYPNPQYIQSPYNPAAAPYPNPGSNLAYGYPAPGQQYPQPQSTPYYPNYAPGPISTGVTYTEYRDAKNMIPLEGIVKPLGNKNQSNDKQLPNPNANINRIAAVSAFSSEDYEDDVDTRYTTSTLHHPSEFDPSEAEKMSTVKSNAQNPRSYHDNVPNTQNMASSRHHYRNFE